MKATDFVTTLKSLPRFLKKRSGLLKRRRESIRDFEIFQSLSKDARFPISKRNLKLYLDDRTGTASIDFHYFFHTAWAARVLAETKPTKHIDISSALLFVGSVSAFIPIEFYEFRCAPIDLPGLTSGEADLCNLPFPSETVESISCMHVVEHIGLGRYGDPIDPEGDLKAAKELQRVLGPGGQLLFVVPLAENPILFFNAHRIYSYEMVLEMFPEMKMMEFALIPNTRSDVGLIRGATRHDVIGEKYACGCFHFVK
jgi:SAM-dependent methyltransferase